MEVPKTPRMGVKVLGKRQAEWAGLWALPTDNQARSAIISSTIGMQCDISIERKMG